MAERSMESIRLSNSRDHHRGNARPESKQALRSKAEWSHESARLQKKN
ncbi:unnamed protein product [Linum tenue]|uniref:Uncharacterized protein n=1 Tax=Linum tenue TaxID=586396 RepID=A0AAV0KSC5_9ROSI|nr:unnamed protein product [Linum tenue]